MGRIATFCPDERLLPRVRASAGLRHELVVCGSWQAFEHAAARADAQLVVLEWLRTEELVERLFDRSARSPDLPMVLLTAQDPEAVRKLSRLVIDEIIWPHEVDRVGEALDRALGGALPNRLARAIDGAESLPPRLRQALTYALRAQQPVLSVADVAAGAGCDRRTLWRQTQQISELIPGCRLQDLLDWIFLLRVAALKVPGRRWSTIAGQLDVHEHTIARIAKRLTGHTLRDLSVNGQAEVARLFSQRILVPLFEPAGGTVSQVVGPFAIEVPAPERNI
jgi:hypothetical protein